MATIFLVLYKHKAWNHPFLLFHAYIQTISKSCWLYLKIMCGVQTLSITSTAIILVPCVSCTNFSLWNTDIARLVSLFHCCLLYSPLSTQLLEWFFLTCGRWSHYLHTSAITSYCKAKLFTEAKKPYIICPALYPYYLYGLISNYSSLFTGL